MKSSTPLKRALELSWPERSVVFQALILVVLFWFALRLVSVEKIEKRLKTASPGARKSELGAKQITELVLAATWRLGKLSTCLTRALASCVLLRRYGYPAVIKIGVARDRGFEAHAWVEDHRGAILSDETAELQRFTRMI